VSIVFLKFHFFLRRIDNPLEFTTKASMILEQRALGPLQCNCSILGCEKTGEAIIIDPGDEAQKIFEILKIKKLKPKYILHTHAHFDHLGATQEVYDQTKPELCLHEGDTFLYENVAMQCALFGFAPKTVPPITHFLKQGEVICFGEHKIEVLHTPGHSPGSLSFHLAQENSPLLFTGDTLFKQGIGRTDLWGGDYPLILKSIQNKLLQFDDHTIVHPGHGPSSSIGYERKENPFLAEL